MIDIKCRCKLVFDMNSELGLCLFMSATVLMLCTILGLGGCELVINVKNQGKEVLRETISGNVTEDTVTLEFLQTDGTIVTHLVDFKNSLQVVHVVVLGEEEQGQSQYQVMCFVTSFPKDEYITSDAISKLRQKNPGTIRSPEEDRGKETFEQDVALRLSDASKLSPHIPKLCSEAPHSTYTRRSDVHMWATTKGLVDEEEALMLPPVSSSPARCSSTRDVSAGCECHYDLCVPWYPCGLKYCRDRSKGTTYRCGIRTCRKCHLYSFHVPQKLACLWDDIAVSTSSWLDTKLYLAAPEPSDGSQ